MAQLLSCFTDSHRLWVPVPVGLRFFSFPVTFGGQWHMSSNHSELIYVHCCWWAMLRAVKLLPVMIIVLIIFSGPLE